MPDKALNRRRRVNYPSSKKNARLGGGKLKGASILDDAREVYKRLKTSHPNMCPLLPPGSMTLVLAGPL